MRPRGTGLGWGPRALAVLALLLVPPGVAASAPSSAPAAAPVTAERRMHALLHGPGAPGAVLRAVVRDGRVDYAALRALRQNLEHAIGRLAHADTTGWDATWRIALQVDLYDLVVMREVMDRWKPGWTPAADGFAMFRDPRVPTRDGWISLDELEKLRTIAAFHEPRLHAAFNCAAASCPPLPAASWLEQLETRRLDDVLEARMRGFVRDTTRNAVDEARRTLRLSRIFDWYAADFGGRAGVLATVGRALGRDLSGWRVEFREYDWSLNAATHPDGSRPR